MQDTAPKTFCQHKQVAVCGSNRVLKPAQGLYAGLGRRLWWVELLHGELFIQGKDIWCRIAQNAPLIIAQKGTLAHPSAGPGTQTKLNWTI